MKINSSLTTYSSGFVCVLIVRVVCNSFNNKNIVLSNCSSCNNGWLCVNIIYMIIVWRTVVVSQW